MTVTMERPAHTAPSPRVATVALARAEARRLWHSPFYWGGALLSTALGVAWAWTRMPTWATFAENSGMSSLVLAMGLLLATHLATGRDQRADAEESTRTMPSGPARRGLAMLVSVPIAVLTGATVHVGSLLLLLPAWPVGEFDPWASAVVLVIPPIGAVIGVLVGRVLPSPAAGPLTGVALSTLLIALLALPDYPQNYASALWPVPEPAWEIGAPRPVGWHLLYLVGVLIAVITAVTWRAWPKASVVVLVAALAGAGVSVERQTAESPAIISMDLVNEYTGPAVLSCRTYQQVDYCSLPHFEGWIKNWREAVEPVAAHLPAAVQRPTVRQIGSSYDLKPITPGVPEVITTESWGRIGGWATDSRMRLAADYVGASVGLNTAMHPDPYCDAAGQHRTVAGLWLLAQGMPDGGARVRSGELRMPRVRYGQAELDAAVDLLDRPYAEVADHLARHWAELLDPSSRALAGLGVTLTPPTAPAAESQGEPRAEGGVCR
ncbi:ABC transporter [Actinoplanes sichuanensis]|nr:ABC transporter [Actinoplanes sichuanensis]